MSGFDADWLDLREPADLRSRNRALAERLLALIAARPDSGAVSITDLGGGTGANMRWLAPLLPPAQHWTVVDHAGELLALARERAAALAGRASPPARIETGIRELDLSRSLAAVEFPEGSIVSASALLDLVSQPWIDELADRIATAGSVAYFTLTYNGVVQFDPALPLDATVIGLVNRHQTTDKGFGAALGPGAAAAFVAALGRRGYETFAASSPWQLGAGDEALLQQLLAGWVRAALEVDATAGQAIEAWAQTRLEQIGRAGLAVVVGHDDVLGYG